MTTLDVKSGTVIGQRYRIERLLGMGGIGSVYLSRDCAEDGARVAVKLLTSRNPAGYEIESLREEFSLLSRLRHPNLVRILDFGIWDPGGVPFLVEEYLEGEDLYRATESWGPLEIVRLMVILTRVVQFLHTRGIIHGDLKSSNALLVGHASETEKLKVLDFGLTVRSEGLARASQAGTLAYMAPELLLGKGAGPRSDLYSMGILIYQLLARRLPFEDEDTGFLIQKQLQGVVDLRPIERLEGGAGLAQLLKALLEKDPARRPSSAEDLIRLMSVASGEDYSQVTGAPLESYFSAGRYVGRARETEYLRQLAARVRESGRGVTVFITGESGSGKTRCMEELKIWALLEGWRVVEANCRAGEERSYGAYRQVLARSEGFSAGGNASPRDDTLFQAEERARSAGFPALEPPTETAAGQFRDHLTREMVCRLASRPTILMLHDFHWADEATTAVLDYLISDVQSHSILVCVSLRGVEAEQGPVGKLIENSLRQLRAERLTLEALDEEAVEALIVSMTGEAELGDSISHWIWQASGGNPFFVEEILKHLVDRGLLHREDGKWKLGEEVLGLLEVPKSVAVVLRHRLERLPEKARELASWLAVVNRSIARDDLLAILRWEPEDLERELRTLAARQMTRSEGKECKEWVEFRHALISEVIRTDLSLRKRQRMHRRIGEALEQVHGAEGHVQELAIHFTEGNAGEKAARYALEAAAQCRAVFANEMALRFLEYVLKNRPGLSGEELCQAAIDAADACCALGIPDRAIPFLNREMRLVKNSSTSVRAGLYMQLSRCFQFSGDNKGSERAARYGLRLLKRAKVGEQDTRIRASLLRQLASTLLVSHHPQKGVAVLEEALQVAIESGDPSTTGHLYVSQSGMNFVTSDFSDGVTASRLAIKILEPLNAIGLLPVAYSHLGINLAGLGKLALARRQHERAVEIARKGRSPLLQAQSVCNLAECYCRCGEFERALSLSKEMLSFASETNNRNVEFAANLTLFEIEINRGDYKNAVHTQALLDPRSLPSLPSYVHAQSLYLSARLSLELGKLDSAAGCLDDLERLGSNGVADYEIGLGRILRSCISLKSGRVNEALHLIKNLQPKLVKKRWAYQICLAKIWLAEAIARTGNLREGLFHGRRALLLAQAMPAAHLEAHARLLIGRLNRLCLDPQNCSGGGLIQGTSLVEARIQFERAADISAHSGALGLQWRAHLELARLGNLMSDSDLSKNNAELCLKVLSSLETRVPENAMQNFCGNTEIVQARIECRNLNEIHGYSSSNTSSLAEMQGEQLRILFRVSRLISSIRDFDVLLSSIVDQLVKALGMERALLYLKESTTDKLSFAKGRNLRRETLRRAEAISESVLRDAAFQARPFVSANARVDPRVSSLQSVISYQLGTVLCAPLKAHDTVLGVLYADHPSPVESLSESTISLFAAFCNLAAVAIDNVLAHRRLLEEKTELEQHLKEVLDGCHEIIGQSVVIQRLRERIAVAASSPLDVLISGESGTGKELVARAIHRAGRRATRNFITADCGSFTDALIESELFGSRKGSFTGSAENRIGFFEAANGGVLFLDEITNLNVRSQAKLLRVLEEREVRRIGETVPRKVDVQVIAATNRDLRREIHKRRFRKDLYYRLGAMEIQLPPLRERLEDVPLLTDWFLAKAAKEEGKARRFEPEAMNLLSCYSYPGNVRELKKIVLACYYNAQGAVIRSDDLPEEVRSGVRNLSQVGGEGKTDADEIYRVIRRGEGSFAESLQKPLAHREFGKSVVCQVIRRALVDAGGSYRRALQLLSVPDAKYAATIQFLKRNDCYLDFRPFRKCDRGIT